MPSFNQQKPSKWPLDKSKNLDNSVNRKSTQDYSNLDDKIQKYPDEKSSQLHKPFMWSLKAAEDVCSAPLYRTLPRPQIRNHSTPSSTQAHNETNGITPDKGLDISANQDTNENAMFNTTLKPPKGTPPVIFDPNHVTETKVLPPTTENIYKQVKGTYTTTNTKFRPKYSLSPNSKSRIFIQNDLFNKSKTSLDPSNLPSKQHFIPLNYSHFFKKGSAMRMKLEKKLTVKLSDDNHKRNSAVRMKSKGALPPPGQTNQLIEIIDKMITFMSTILFKDIQNLTAYATKYREYINNSFHTNSRNITIRNVNSKVNLPGVASIVQKAHNQLQGALAPIDMTTVTSSNNINKRPSSQNHLLANDDESNFIHLLVLFCGLPNHRPIAEMSIVLMWFFSELTESTGIQLWEAHNQSTFQFNKYSKNIRQSLKLLTMYQADRNGADDVLKYEKEDKLHAEDTLKSWYTNQYKVFEKTSSSSPLNAYGDDRNLNQSMNQLSMYNQALKSGSTINQHRHLVNYNNNNQYANASSSPQSSYYQPQPPSSSSRPSTASGAMVSPGYRPVSSQQQAMRLDMSNSSGNNFSHSSGYAADGDSSNKYPKHSVSPGHLRSITNTNNNANNSFDSPYNFSSSSLSTSMFNANNNELYSSQSQISSSAFESVLVKVLSHKGMDAFLIAMNWVPNPTANSSSSSSKSINNDSTSIKAAQINKALLTCTNRVTRCKHTENTSSTYVINSDIGKMVNQSLRAFGAGVLVDDILEDPPPPQSVVYQPVMTIDNKEPNNHSNINKKSEHRSNKRESHQPVTTQSYGQNNNATSSDKGSTSRRGSTSRSSSNSPSKIRQFKLDDIAVTKSITADNHNNDDFENNNEDGDEANGDDNDGTNSNKVSQHNIGDDASSAGSVAFGGSDTDDNFAIEDALMMAETDPLLQSIPSTWISPSNVDFGNSGGKAKSKSKKKPKLNFIKANKQAPFIKTSTSDTTNEKKNNKLSDVSNTTNSKSKSKLPTSNKPKLATQSSSTEQAGEQSADVPMLSLIKRIVLKSNSSSFEESLKYLYKCGPRLENKQCLMICMSLLSDCTRTIILGIMVLVKHAWAGKELDISSVQAVLGGPFCRAILGLGIGGEEGEGEGVNTSSSLSSTTLLQELLQWLQANRHTSATFKVANQTQTETALQNLFSFWSELMMSDFTKESAASETQQQANSSSNNGDGINVNHRERCCVRLVWPHKYKVHKVFREPHTFIPNMNVI